MAMNLTEKTPNAGDTELIGSRIGRISPDIVNQSGAAVDDGDDDEEFDDERLLDDDDEPVDEDGDPTGEHDQHRDDNYALGGKVAR